MFRGISQKVQITKQLITQLIHFKKPEKYKGKLKGINAQYAKIAAKVLGRSKYLKIH